MVSSPAIVRRGCKCRILEMHLKWSDQQLKTIMDTCRLLYWNFMATTNQKSTIDTHTQKEKESKHNTKYSHQITRGQNKKGREEARITKTIPKQLTKWQNMVRTCMSAKSLQLCPTLATPWNVSRQAPLSMGFFRQEYWNGLPCSPPGVFPTQKSNPHLWHLLHCRRVLYTLSQLGSLSNQATCGKREESHLLMFCCPDLKWLMNTASKHTEEKIMHLSWIEHKLYLSIKKSGK